MVCNGLSHAYVTKDFHGDCGLDLVEYDRCEDCGFVFSHTHFVMNDAAWSNINDSYHRNYFETDNNPDDPRWMQRISAQRDVLDQLVKAGLIDSTLGAYDYGCGDGKLADMVTSGSLKVDKYDKYISGGGSDYLTEKDVEKGGFGLVINTSVMEHVRDLETLDTIAQSVHPQRGILAIHTLVAEHVPQDASWFYLLPVHVSFFTNHAMEILVKRWEFSASLYVVEPRMWFLFRSEEQARRAYDALCDIRDDLAWKPGFVDYWK